MRLADRVKEIRPSPTLTIDSKAKALKEEGVDVVGFGAGEPDFDTPENIKEAAIRAIRGGFTKYCPVGGTVELKEAIVVKLKKENGLSYSPSQVVVSCGAKHSLYNLCQVLFQKGDEVIIPSPYWVSYLDMVSMTEATPVVVKTGPETGFRMDPEQLRGAVTPRTKGLILNSPGNPTGAGYDEAALRAIAEIAVERGIVVISDEIYEKLVYDGFRHVSIASFGKEIYDLTFTVNGVSKTYAMTGWRIGYSAGRKDIIEAVTAVQSNSTSNPTSISLKASYEALVGPQDAVPKMVAEFDRRRRYMVERLNRMPGVSCVRPLGAFYAFPDLSSYFGRSYQGMAIKDSSDLAAYLLEGVKVAAVPGIAFGAEGFIRLSYATSMENIRKGMDRIEEALGNLK